jgi:DNA invertase Pin-like site-specific DNA recombinase
MSYCVFLYCRLSPRPDGSYEGVDLQERWGREYAAQTWPGVPVRVFRDAGLSAAKDDVVRPGYEALRKAIANGEGTYLWTVEQSRLQRLEGPWFALAAELETAGIKELHTKRDGIVRVGDVVAGIKAVLYADEVRRLKVRVNDKLDARAADGVPPGSRPFGYRPAGRREHRTYEIVAEQAQAIVWAAGRVLAGWSLARIAAELREQGMTGPHRVKVRNAEGLVLLDDGRWVDPRHDDVKEHAVTRPSVITPQAVKGWLTSPSIAGLRVHRGEVTGKGNWPPILDEQTWRQVCAVLAAPRVVHRADGGTYPVSEAHAGPAGRKYLLTGGLAVCGVCSAPMTGAAKQLRNTRSVRTVPYLLCHPNKGGRACTGIKLAETEAHVAASLFAELETRPGFAAALSADQHAERRAELAAALEAVQAERIAYARDAAAGTMTRAEWLAMRPVFDERESKLNDELREIPPPAGRADWQEVREAWDDLELDEQRAFLRRYIAQVTIVRAKPGTKGFDSDRVKIGWREI